MAFGDCRKLTEVSIPGSVQTIDAYAFSKTGLTSVSIPASVTNLTYGVFSNCNNLMSIIVDDANEAYCEMDGVLYRCLVSNAAGDVTSETATLTVNVKPVENPKPTITTQPADVTVNEGATAAFSVVASNATTYQWYYQKPDTTVWNSVLVNGTSATYTLTTAERHNGNTYR